VPRQSSQRARRIDTAETIGALVGITLGVVPLVQRVTRHEQGWVFRWLFGELQDPSAYVLPLLILVALTAAIAALEMIKKR
jgi:hypothetical protein